MKAFPTLLLLLLASFCLPDPVAADALNPTLDYKAHGTRKLKGSVGIGVFTYRPFTERKVEYKTEIYSETRSRIILKESVAEHVRKGTGKELYHAGVRIDQEADVALTGEILELRVDDRNDPVDWTYSLRYTIVDPQSGAVLYGVACPDIRLRSPRAMVPGEYAEALNELIFSGYECLIADPRVSNFFSAE